MKIKYRRIIHDNNELVDPLKIIKKGEYVDLRCAEFTSMDKPKIIGDTVHFEKGLIPLGIAMKLPEGYEAIVLPRSSTYKNYGIIMNNSVGLIDNSYSGNNDEWKFPAVALERCAINSNIRICQFRIILSQKATIWQKLKWLFTNSIEFVEVDNLDSVNRGGIGSTGNY